MMAGAVKDGTEDFEMTVFYAVLTENDMILRDKPDSLCLSCDKLKVIYLAKDPAACESHAPVCYGQGFFSKERES